MVFNYFNIETKKMINDEKKKFSIDVCFLISSSAKKSYQKLSKTYSAIEPPTWALLLAQSSRSVGFKVSILDANAENLSDEDVLNRINKLKNPCKQSDEDKGSWSLTYTDKKGKKHRNCHTSEKNAKRQISAIEAEADDAEGEIINERLIRNYIKVIFILA